MVRHSIVRAPRPPTASSLNPTPQFGGKLLLVVFQCTSRVRTTSKLWEEDTVGDCLIETKIRRSSECKGLIIRKSESGDSSIPACFMKPQTWLEDVKSSTWLGIVPAGSVGRTGPGAFSHHNPLSHAHRNSNITTTHRQTCRRRRSKRKESSKRWRSFASDGCTLQLRMLSSSSKICVHMSICQ